jgi:cysteine synthase A
MGQSGIGQGRITDNLAPEVAHLSGALHIPDEKSIEMVYRLLDEEGIYVGASSSLNVVAAHELALKKGPGNYFVQNRGVSASTTTNWCHR